MTIRVGDVVETIMGAVWNRTPIPVGRRGLVTHVGLDTLVPTLPVPAIVVRFETLPACVYDPGDLQKIVGPMPAFSVSDAILPKPDEFLQVRHDRRIVAPGGQWIPKGTLLLVKKCQGPYYVDVVWMTSPTFTVPIGEVRDYWDDRIVPATSQVQMPDDRETPPLTIRAQRSVVHCRIKTCAAENDAGVATCWRCGNPV